MNFCFASYCAFPFGSYAAYAPPAIMRTDDPMAATSLTVPSVDPVVIQLWVAVVRSLLLFFLAHLFVLLLLTFT